MLVRLLTGATDGAASSSSLWIAALVGVVRPGRRVRRGAQAGLPAARVGVEGRLGHPRGRASRSRPATPSRSCVHSDDGVTSPEVQARAEAIFADVADSDHVVGVASPFTDGGRRARSPRTARRRTPTSRSTRRTTSSPPREAKALVEPILAAGDDTLQVEVGGPVAALSQTAPFGSEGIGLIAAAIILLFTFGSAVAMGLPLLTAAVRPRDRDRARRAAAAGRRRPGLGAAHRGDGRHRRRHRLRAAHRHPVPQQPRRGPGAATGHR